MLFLLLLTLHRAEAAVAPCTGKIIENGLRVFERGENLLKMVYHVYTIVQSVAFKLSQSSEIVLQI